MFRGRRGGRRRWRVFHVRADRARGNLSTAGSDQIVDSKLASYGMENPIYAIVQLAQTTMTSYLGKITLDKTFEERDVLNVNISVAGCLHLSSWVIQSLVWSLGDISPPRGVRAAMEMQAEAERKKRAQVLESEGHSYKKY
ncbi:hypothetical protein QQ045_015945 [Rhodiola kirilowii]